LDTWRIQPKSGGAHPSDDLDETPFKTQYLFLRVSKPRRQPRHLHLILLFRHLLPLYSLYQPSYLAAKTVAVVVLTSDQIWLVEIDRANHSICRVLSQSGFVVASTDGGEGREEKGKGNREEIEEP
jgi:hypothetical protein